MPEAGSSLLLPARIGHARAAAVLLLGEFLTAEEALSAGLLTGIVPRDVLQAHARAKALKLAGKPAAALAASRRLMRGDPAALHARMREEEAAFSAALASPEARAAFAAFLDRRPARAP